MLRVPIRWYALKPNTISPEQVVNSTGTHAYSLREIPISEFELNRLDLISRLKTLSADTADLFDQHGVLVAVLPQGKIIYQYVTSRSYAEISDIALGAAFETLMGQIGENKIEKFQFFQTHPNTPRGRTLSSTEVDWAERFSRLLGEKGHPLPVEYYALPWGISFEPDTTYQYSPFVGYSYQPLGLSIDVVSLQIVIEPDTAAPPE